MGKVMRYCTSCKDVARCKKTFGRYWNVKSNEGNGCKAGLPTIKKHDGASAVALDGKARQENLI